MKTNKKNVLFGVLMVLATNVQAQTSEINVTSKIANLQTLIHDLEDRKIDSYKEKMTVRVAEVFLKYARWDEKNVAFNQDAFKMVNIYKDQAGKLAQELPEFERKDILTMLDASINTATQLKEGKISRKPYHEIDWSKIVVKQDQLLYNDRPVFLSDYTWKPETKELTDYFGQLDGYLLSPMQLADQTGELVAKTKKELQEKASGNAGFIFIANNNVPQWTAKAYGDQFNKIIGKPFTAYDIDNPGARNMMSDLFAKTVPFIAAKNYSQLGYMLVNEPRWANYTNGKKKVYFRSDVSKYTIDKFITWLKDKHDSIAALNALWGTNFSNFDAVATAVPIDISTMGTAKWYDWTTFNQERVTQWIAFLKAEIIKYDPAAKVHLKIMPSIFTNNDADSGIDFEALTTLSGINGNDVAAHYNNTRETADWQADYVLGWRELFMGYDFLKSIQPDQINFNSESHLITTNHARDLYMNPKYVRAVTWAAHTLGLNATQTWYWPRAEDGSFKKKLTNAYAGSLNQQPRVTQELESTMIDLNTFSEEITAMQEQRKPIRVFYSKTTANQKATYMDDLFKLYESLNFEGLPLGFATSNSIQRIDSKNWDVIAIYKTEKVTQAEFDAVQSYLNKGGKVLIDDVSFKSDEYGRPLKPLVKAAGMLQIVSVLENMKKSALEIVQNLDHMPKVTVEEVVIGAKKKCTWRSVTAKDGRQVLSVINLGKEAIQIKFKMTNSTHGVVCTDLINGVAVAATPLLKPYEVYFVSVSEQK
ncbi:beta-galactosidase [Flavobacterium sp. 28A]|uniref:beta-galactosidase n=1 Tax=Flavobacterium sp. 28A TaxID=2735895 RepID=UPI00157056E7|nr:beta-galactosidase [Flavobacterium sp. 28A]NRT14973.1 beta-galactosidase [Flavobacterium sp. 28A]